MKKLIKENIRNKFLSGIISENQYNEAVEEGYSDGGKYNLSSQENVEGMMRDIVGILAKYTGTNSTDNAAVANDNRVILYNMLNSGEFKKNISQIIPPSSMHQAYDHENNKAQYWTNNPDAMAEFLNSIGITNHNFKSTEKNAMDDMFKGSTPDDMNF
jgi:hypothetical protein